MAWLSHTRAYQLALAATWLTLTLAFAGTASAQLIKVEAGASDMVPTVGGSVSVQGPGYEGYLGAGMLNGAFRLGTYAKTMVGPYQVTAGDQNLELSLPTDVFGGTEFLTTRGVGATLPGDDHVFVFAGVTTLPAGSPIFQAFQDQTPLALVFMDKAITANFHVYSRSILSREQTSIEGFNWQVRDGLKTDFSAGIGSNHPYIAGSVDADGSWYDVKAGYIEAGSGFRRITTPSLFVSEPDRENLLVTLKPYSSLVLVAGHENFLAPQGQSLNLPFERASVDQFQSSFELAKFRLGAGMFESHSPVGHNVSDGFSVSRSITRNVDGTVSYYENLSGPHPRASYLISTVRETISPKISLLQVINRTPGNTNFLFGGSYTTNRLSVQVDYQTLYMPFLSNPLVTGIGVTVQLKLWRGLEVDGNTFRSPDGKLRYTASVSTLLTPSLHFGGSESQAPKFGDYVIRGHVRSEGGSPVEGAAIQLGDQTVYTNAAGEFILRVNRSQQVAVTVLTEEFLSPLHFTVVSAPATVKAASEDSAADTLIVLRPVANTTR